MRVLFSDGWNSFVHFGIGAAAAVSQPVIVGILFVGYQLTQANQSNTVVDLLEFALGYAVTWRYAKTYGIF